MLLPRYASGSGLVPLVRSGKRGCGWEDFQRHSDPQTGGAAAPRICALSTVVGSFLVEAVVVEGLRGRLVALVEAGDMWCPVHLPLYRRTGLSNALAEAAVRLRRRSRRKAPVPEWVWRLCASEEGLVRLDSAFAMKVIFSTVPRTIHTRLDKSYAMTISATTTTTTDEIPVPGALGKAASLGNWFLMST
jgi:hypothetical protein